MIVADAPALPPAFTSGEVPAICIAYTAASYGLRPALILAALKAEGGRVGMERRNANGTIDIGPGQINSRWLPVLKAHGIDRAALREDGCLNVWVMGWRLRSGLNSTPNYWRGVGRYHSSTARAGRDLNGRYAMRVWDHYRRINQLEMSWWGIPGLIPVRAPAQAPLVTDLLMAQTKR